MKKVSLICRAFLIIIFLCLCTDALAYDCALQGQLTGTYVCDNDMTTQDSCTVLDSTSTTLQARYSITLSPGFHAEAGSTLVVQITEGPDDDEDGLPDWWEADYYNPPEDGPGDDPDGDGLNNLAEYLHGTSPSNPDTDEDGMDDYWETLYSGLDPLSDDANQDLDGDGLINLTEYEFGSNPSDPPDPGKYIVYEYDELGRITTVIRRQ